MQDYLVKNAAWLSESEIQTILKSWDVEDWKQLTPDQFRERFEYSEFHILNGKASQMLSVARINFKFRVGIDEKEYEIAELVGFVTIEILKGYGKVLLRQMADNLQERNVEAIGFCRKRTSPYYESAGFKVLRDKVKHLREKKEDAWYTPKEDHDIVALRLTDQTLTLLENISDERPAYLFF